MCNAIEKFQKDYQKLDKSTMYDKQRIVQLTNQSFFKTLANNGFIYKVGNNPIGNMMYGFYKLTVSQHEIILFSE